jgi:CelD/BcsL family acetyltransferase involved in cellulose biosynthesis
MKQHVTSSIENPGVETRASTDDDRWESLARRSGATPFMWPGWIRAWCDAFGGGELELLTIGDQGRFEAAMPVLRKRGVVASASNWHTPSFEPIASDEATLDALLDAALDQSRTRLDLAFVNAAGTGRRCADLARRRGFTVIERTIERSPYLETEGDWEAYRADRSSKFWRDTRRRARRLQEQGEVAFESVTGGTRLDERLDDGFRVEAAGWKGSQGTAISSSSTTEGFYRQIAHWADERGWLRLWFLRLDGRAIAFVFAIVHEHVHYSLKVGYDPEFRSHAPGRLLHERILRDAFTDDIRRFEFLGSPDPWKLEWTDEWHELSRVQAFPRSLAGSTNALLWKVGRPLVKQGLTLA